MRTGLVVAALSVACLVGGFTSIGDDASDDWDAAAQRPASWCRGAANDTSGLTLSWYAPVLSGNGYGNEAVEYLTGFDALLQREYVDRIAESLEGRPRVTRVCWFHHGDAYNSETMYGEWADNVREALERLAGRTEDALAIDPARHIVVCHSSPGAWSVPRSEFDAVAVCPPHFSPSATATQREVLIGRTMFESDRLPAGWAQRMLRMTQIWVPTAFHTQVFTSPVAGERSIPASMVRVIPEAIDAVRWDHSATADDEVNLLKLAFEREARAGRTWASLIDVLGAEYVMSELHFIEKDINDDALLGETDAAPLVSRGDRDDDDEDVSRGDVAVVPAGACSVRFLAVFKWEWRKAWDVLVAAFLEEFDRAPRRLPNGTTTAGDTACLFIKTQAFHDDAHEAARQRGTLFGDAVDHHLKRQVYAASVLERDDDEAAVQRRTLAERGIRTKAHLSALRRRLFEARRRASRPIVRYWSHPVPQASLPRLYAAADAVLSATRGEGWGRPAMEAMAVGRPVVATNWSGYTAFVNNSTGYVLPVDRLVEVPSGPFQGHRMAEPSVMELRRLLRDIYSDVAAAQQRGDAGRQFVRDHFAPDTIARTMLSTAEEARADKAVDERDL